MVVSSELKTNNVVENKKIIFFDGVCNLCNGFIDFVIRKDKKKEIYYCSLQSDLAKEILKDHDIILGETFSTFYFYDGGKVYNKSTAILRILKKLTLVYKVFASISFIIPPFLRNAMYSLIAKNRYRLFGKKETCRLPSPEEQAQFL